MNIGDLIWNTAQDSNLHHVQTQLDQMAREHSADDWDVRKLAAENLELKLRHGLLVRLLIRKGLITAQEYAALIAETQSNPDSVNE